ncbi:hypothetical protein, partial [Candidatus Frackibacter sp. WG13]|uniref:hypothetical protein n=1 Tax=Candidatus Frackibacter sp. WG13 TaxID=2017978 RepID=UPI0008DF9B9A
MIKKIIYVNGNAAQDRYNGKEGFYVKETGEFFAHNTLSNNATNDQLNKQAEFYTRTINNIQQEEQNKAQQAFLALTDLGITAIDSWNSASELITETGELTFDIAKKPYQLKGRTGIGKNNYIPYSKGHPILSKVGEKAVDGTLLHSEIEVELANREVEGGLIKDEDIKVVNERISGNIVGAVISKTKDRVEDINSMAETINEAKKVYDKFNKGKRINFEKDLAKTKKIGREQLGAFFAVWAPAIVEVKGWDKYNNLQSLGKVERAKKIEEFKEDVQLIAKYNRIAAHVMETMMMLGSLLIQSTIPIGTVAGLILMVLAQPISNSVKEILIKENNDQGNELRLGDYTTIVIDNIVEWFDMTRFIGDSNLCLRQEYNNRPLIQERRIDAPGLIGGMKAFIKDGPFEKLFIQLENLVLGKDIKAFDAQTYGQQLEEKYHVETKLKDIAMHYGSLATIGEFIKDKDKDFSFVAFFDCKEKATTIMDRIIENTFERIDGKEKYQVYAYKEVEHAKDIPRLIHYNKRNKSNQIVVYRTKEQKGTAPVYFKRAAPGAAQMYKAANTETKVETRPKPYLKQLKKNFSKDYLRKLLSQRIEVGYGESWYDNDYYHMVSLKSLLNKEAKEYGLNLAKDDISYKEILNQYNNRKFIKEGLVGNVFGQDGMKYDYIMIEDSLFAKEPNFFGPNWNIMYGSIKNQDKEQEER